MQKLHTHSGILITYDSKGHILVLANWYLCIAIGSISGNMCQLLSVLEVCMTAEKQRGECTITQLYKRGESIMEYEGAYYE